MTKRISRKGIERISQLFKRVSALEQQINDKLTNTNVANSHYLVNSGEDGIPGIAGDVPGTASVKMLRRWGDTPVDEKPIFELGTKQKVFNAFGAIGPNQRVLVHRDDHGDLWVDGGESAKVAFVQTPVGGIPSRVTSGRAGKADCRIMVEAPADAPGTGIQAGDLLRHISAEIEVRNWTESIVGEEGSRLVQVDRHEDGAWVIGWICDDTGDPDFPPFDPDDPFWDPDTGNNGNCQYLPGGGLNPDYNPGTGSSPLCPNPVLP